MREDDRGIWPRIMYAMNESSVPCTQRISPAKNEFEALSNSACWGAAENS
jgi:hypothetical protein